MFKHLKRKFVLINMSLLTIVFVAIFTAIYILTAISGERQTSFMLNDLMFSPPRPFPDKPAVATSIIVELDKENNVIKTFSFWDMDEELLEQIVSGAVNNKRRSANIKVEDTYYAFLKHDTPYGKKIAFVDRSPQQRTLTNLLLVFLSVGGASLLVLFWISLYLANRAVDPIKYAFERQKQFFADASHELKTPLTIIKTNASLLAANGDEPVKSQAKWIEYINSQTDRMSKLVDDMLSLVRLDQPEQTLCFSEFDLSKTISGVLLSFEAVLFENNIKLDTQLQREIMFRGDRERIKRLINVLMDNAVKNTPADGSIAVRLDRGKNKIQLMVRNTGAGIPAEHIEKIFERFYRADTSRARESGGYGLGLAIAKSIVEQHKGRISVRSNAGENTSFVVELPAER